MVDGVVPRRATVQGGGNADGSSSSSSSATAGGNTIPRTGSKVGGSAGRSIQASPLRVPWAANQGVAMVRMMEGGYDKDNEDALSMDGKRY
jgi:hypothetical protein